jgi:hypothetical protein
MPYKKPRLQAELSYWEEFGSAELANIGQLPNDAGG